MGLLSQLSAGALVLASCHAATLDKRAAAFQADSSINVAGILAAAKSSLSAGKNVLATFPAWDGGPSVKIQGDWLNLTGVSAFHYLADMDVDCDGVDFNCPHNPDGQSDTSFGHLSAKQVPFYVIPVSFSEQQQNAGRLKPNAVGAIICNGNMYYGIFGDEDGDDPEVIGEASLLMAQTCFPNDGLDGGTGHEVVDVEYVIFGTKVPSGVGDQTINIATLKTLGDQQAKLLQTALGLGGSGGGTTPPPTKSDKCQSDDDCPGSNVCCSFASISNICIAQNSCSNSKCSSSGVTGSCDGG
ncbi:hypothetical protein EXIGLDRAFT_837880 [Exidia glandulosa HHB12029]|uniref:Endo-chitosanase n=1 Tax=Exidia glandulosa HHB12029 TaxID=1314781 RepID=A0A165GDI7_EXIGL|nr:hypothetical protein EXIGLDRAFT_839608 [Exidia glandulosa HHB12029]KZV90361.1 hypothetical protein EXIGLDRAFT_837880 [Exidia glandulosa HHB12029]